MYESTHREAREGHRLSSSVVSTLFPEDSLLLNLKPAAVAGLPGQRAAVSTPHAQVTCRHNHALACVRVCWRSELGTYACTARALT